MSVFYGLHHSVDARTLLAELLRWEGHRAKHVAHLAYRAENPEPPPARHPCFVERAPCRYDNKLFLKDTRYRTATA